MFQRLELKGKSIKTSTAVAQTDIDALWQSLAAIEPNCPISDQVSLMLSQVYKQLLIASIMLTHVYSKMVMNFSYVIFIIYLIILKPEITCIKYLSSTLNETCILDYISGTKTVLLERSTTTFKVYASLLPPTSLFL